MEKNIEDDIKKYECQLCGIKFTNQNMLLKHTTKCQKSVRYYCDRPCTIVVQISCQDLNDLPLFCLNLHSIPVIFQMPKEQIWNCNSVIIPPHERIQWRDTWKFILGNGRQLVILIALYSAWVKCSHTTMYAYVPFRNYMCEVCGNAFTTLNCLKEHIR